MMNKLKIIFVLVIVLSLGTGAVAAEFSGWWESEIRVGNPVIGWPWPDVEYFALANAVNGLGLPDYLGEMVLLGVKSILGVDYTIAGWTFGSVSRFTFVGPCWFDLGDPDGWIEQDFLTEGAIGAFAVTSHLRFVPETPTFTFLRSTVATVIAGLDLRGKFLIVEDGSGLRLRASGAADDLTLTAELFMNMVMDPPPLWVEPVEDWYWAVVAPVHDLRFTGLRVDALVPFYSFALRGQLDFTTEGFDDLTLTVTDLMLGIPQLYFDLEVEYALVEKRVAITPRIRVIDWVHFEPLISLLMVDHKITGLSLDGLRMAFTVDTVTFTSYSRFDYVPVREGTDYWQVYRIDVALPDIDLGAALYFEDGAFWLFEAGKIAIDMTAELVPGLRFSTGLSLTDYGITALTFGFRLDW